MSATFTAYDPATLPTSVVSYLDAHDAARHADASAVFAPEAGVLDDGQTYQGMAAISAWVAKTSTEYTYTSTRIGQIASDTRPVVQVRLDGNFPGGSVILRYQFELGSGLVTRLAIEV